jgi:hypothetical protein
MPTPNFYAVGNYNRICAAVKGVTEDPPPLLPFVKATFGSEMGLLGQLYGRH